MFHTTSKGFTLLELLIVIAIIAVLAAVTVVVLNPAELLRQARDANRVASLSSLETAIGMFLVDGRGAPRGASNVVHISLPDPNAPACTSHTLPGLPSGWAYRCVTAANLHRIDGHGWIPIDFTALPGGSPLATLPIDPVNNATLYFAYVTGGSYALTAMMESSRFLQRNANRDGGTDPARIEAGTSRALWARATGLVGYWPFDGNFQDHSGLANHGTQTGGVSFAEGRQNQAGSFDGVNDRVNAPHSESLNITDNITIKAWVRSTRDTPYHVIGKNDRWFSTGAPGWHISTASVPADLLFEFQDGINRWAARFHTGRIFDWTHIVAVKQGNSIMAYVNGALRSTITVSGSMLNSFPLEVGAFRGTELWFMGHIDEVRIYNRALSADEIRAIFEATR